MQISDAELEVMNVVWSHPACAASDIHARLTHTQDWSRQTVKTLLSRLVDKGALSATQDGRRFLYTAITTRQAYEARATRRFVDKVYAGRAAPLVAHLAQGEGLSDDDIAELEALIEALKS